MDAVTPRKAANRVKTMLHKREGPAQADQSTAPLADAIADFWRFWVVHLWVEDFLELFTTVMVAYMFVLLGVVRERIALTVVSWTSFSTPSAA